MPTNLSECARFLAQEGVRHHVDRDENAIRIAFVTQRYRNLRDERLLIVRLEFPDEGYRCRAVVPRAFRATALPAAACLACCRLAAETPLVAAEYDSDGDDLRLVVETVVEDGRLTRLQLMSMVDRLVEAAEAWHALVAEATVTTAPRPRRSRKPRGAA